MADEQTLIELTADIVAAHLSNNAVAVGDVAALVAEVHAALAGLDAPAPAPQVPKKTPAVSIRASVKPQHLVCLECGSTQKMLKRHLHAAHDSTPEQYRAEFGLPHSYPMVAPDYSHRRAELARKIGLGTKGRGAKGRAANGSPRKAKATTAGATRRPRKG